MNSIALSLGALSILALHVQAASSIATTGANADLIWEGGDSAATAFDFPNSYTYIADTVGFGGEVGNPGVPQSFTSVSDSTIDFSLLGEFNELNALQMGLGGSGTLTVSSPAAYSSLYLLTSSAQGSAMGTVTITFSDTSTLVLDFQSPDWYTTAEGAAAMNAEVAWAPQSSSRSIFVNTSNGGYYYSGGDTDIRPFIYSYELEIPEAYQDLDVESLAFSMSSTGGATVSTAIFGVSGTMVPEPATTLFAALGALGFLRRRRA
ncbi:hypothetical protein HNR46_002716 [Haloferula luteola]|uniref:Ice-binding protein C-terminal domain-containing protein n=1 Tax=Haloferula luteola TaxID=595692 RepID=A0A840VF82_9BACT|nr:PEP-CTERM sorting domain-containing protein [Haloferula luteola]MBB5352470.1 hypothetical protein [Haloferula luteola]